MKKQWLVIAVLVAGLLTGCSLPRDPKMQAQADQLTPCEKLEALVKAYNTDFAALKGSTISQRFLDIWAARVDAVGKGCQIWKSGSDVTYMCTLSAPNETVAMDWYEEAVASIDSCLIDWQQDDAAKEADTGRGTLWFRSGNYPKVAVQVFPVRGSHWAIYYFVGDRDNWF